MYKYIDKKTGATLETACPVNGGNWVPVEEPKPKKKAPRKKKASKEE